MTKVTSMRDDGVTNPLRAAAIAAGIASPPPAAGGARKA